MMGMVNIRKQKDAVIWGSKEADRPLPPAFYDAIDKYIKSYKKEVGGARKSREIDQQEADPISWTLFNLFVGWALEDGNVFVWVYALLQWNCMARSINISPLGLHNVNSSEDF